MSLNHTFNHLNGWKTKTDVYLRNVDKCNEFMNVNLFRPPFGKIKPKQIKKLKKYYKIILWSVMSYDFHVGMTKEQCFENVRKHTRCGSIVVFHDSVKAREKVLYALPKMLDYFTKSGYQFKSVTAL